MLFFYLNAEECLQLFINPLGENSIIYFKQKSTSVSSQTKKAVFGGCLHSEHFPFEGTYLWTSGGGRR